MKKSILILAMIGLGFQSYAQETDVLYSATLKRGDVPQVVLKSIEANFPDYIVKDYYAVPIDYVAGNVYVNRDVDPSDIDSYQIAISSKDRRLIANLDENGKLMSTVENIKDTPPPMAVSRSIASAYPGWTIGKDNFHMVNYVNGKTVEHYRFLLSKDGKTKRVHTDGNGKILK
ncbi:hypothetical protein [Kaistella sp.]|uniref:hypothetical protein n=1 Tax=Kaistella sp. TaxID=2782235 RepID=UPI003C3D03E0